MDVDDAKKLFDTIDNIKTANGFVTAEKFAELFSESSDNPSYQELINIDEQNNYGYKKFFDKCKEEGLIE